MNSANFCYQPFFVLSLMWAFTLLRAAETTEEIYGSAKSGRLVVILKKLLQVSTPVCSDFLIGDHFCRICGNLRDNMTSPDLHHMSYKRRPPLLSGSWQARDLTGVVHVLGDLTQPMCKVHP